MKFPRLLALHLQANDEEEQLELTPVSLQRDADELTPCADAGFGEELLQGCFHRTLGYSASLRDFFIHQALEDIGKNLPFSFRKSFLFRLLTRPHTAHRLLQEFAIKPDLPSEHIADSLDEQCRRVVFHKDSGNAAANQVCSLFLLHACSNNKDFAAESLLSRQAHEFSPVMLTEIEVEQHDIHASLSQLFESFFDGVAVRNNSETWLCGQQPSHIN